MNMSASIALAISSVLGFVSCVSQQQPPLPQNQPSIQTSAPKLGLTREEVLQIFRERATPEQLTEFDQLRTKADSDSKEQVLNLVVLHLKHWELVKIGILPVFDEKVWVIALAPLDWALEVNQAFSRVLEPEHIYLGDVPPYHGMRVWSVPREQFFRARRAILSITNLSALEVRLFEPKFRTE